MVLGKPWADMINACFERLGVDAAYTPAGGDSITVRVIAKRPDEIVGFGGTRIHTETAVFDLRVSEVATPRPGDRLTVAGSEYVVQGEPDRDPERLVWTVETYPA
jgi:hypothetical protein